MKKPSFWPLKASVVLQRPQYYMKVSDYGGHKMMTTILTVTDSMMLKKIFFDTLVLCCIDITSKDQIEVPYWPFYVLDTFWCRR